MGLDWELSTIGHPIADLAYNCLLWRLPKALAGGEMSGLDFGELGIPADSGYVAAYCRRTGQD